MKLFRHSELEKAGAARPVVAIGNFDGVHLGHRKVVELLLEKARDLNAPSAVLTFAPHPRQFFQREKTALSILTLRDKISLFRQLGVEMLCILRFDALLASMSAKSFIDEVLVRQLQVRHVITGEDFIFGAGRSGNSAMLQDASSGGAFGYSSVPAQLCPLDEVCSSSRIREFLSQGNVEHAGALLGRPYAISGRVRRGDGRGKSLGYPTVNLALPPQLLLPAHGVYAARVKLGDASHEAVANLGIRPTFGGTSPVLEAHLLDTQKDVYGQHAQVQLLHYLRTERKFDGPEALMKQIGQDIEQARRFLKECA